MGPYNLRARMIKATLTIATDSEANDIADDSCRNVTDTAGSRFCNHLRKQSLHTSRSTPDLDDDQRSDKVAETCPLPHALWCCERRTCVTRILSALNSLHARNTPKRTLHSACERPSANLHVMTASTLLFDRICFHWGCNPRRFYSITAKLEGIVLRRHY